MRCLCIVAAASVLLPFAADPAGAAVFSNPTRIETDAPSPGAPVFPAVPYPSNINVSGLGGTVNDVNVTLCGLSATFPSDVDIMLVAPGGASAVILSDVGGNGNDAATDPLSDRPVFNITLTLDDAAASPLPGGPPLVAGTFRPLDDDNENDNSANLDIFSNPAPPPSGNVALSTFNGIDPNGTWSLYVIDDFPADAGDGEFQLPTFSCGWSIDITTSGGGGPTTTTPTTTTTTPTTTTTRPPTTTTTTTAPTTTTTRPPTTTTTGPTTTTTAPPGGLTCFGYAVTMVGTAGNDTLLGSNRADVIMGLGGNDVIESRAGNDLVCAGDGDDNVTAGTGNDTVSGGNGADTLIGAADDDDLQGDAGNDTIEGRGGNDRLTGGADVDLCRGGDGIDTFITCETERS